MCQITLFLALYYGKSLKLSGDQLPGSSALRPGLNPKPVHVGFMVDIESLGQAH
jgi:hypothetical protein